MNNNTRITLTDDMRTILVKMCDGNPGALNVLITLVKESEKIDLDAAFGPYTHLLNLDSAGIYGPSIWVLFKDTCGQNIVNFVAVIRAWQLGIIDDEQLKAASNRDGAGRYTENGVTLNLDDVLREVRKKLPEFGKSVVGAL